jgi:hypothetical protein
LKGRSTTHELVDVLHHWHQALDRHQSVRAVFIDYAKAFDHVDHTTVIAKLRALGVSDIIVRWICSFLKDRQQRVKLTRTFSKWITLTGAMPQGSFLGPLIFLILIDDLTAPCLVHKFVDDTTLSETLNKNQTSLMPAYFQEVLNWSKTNLMNINFAKTKEMIIGSLNNDPPSALIASSNNIIERVHTYKLLGITLNDKLKWENHINSICSKASSRLYFLKLLKRSRVSMADLLYYYSTIVRPVLEYACQVWHASLTQEQSAHIEKIQKRALRIIYGCDSYDHLCMVHSIEKLELRREELNKTFFKTVLQDSSCLHYLLPVPRPIDTLSNLRKFNKYETIRARTDKYKKIIYSQRFELLPIELFQPYLILFHPLYIFCIIALYFHVFYHCIMFV